MGSTAREISTYYWDVTISSNDYPYYKDSIKRTSGWFAEVIPEEPVCYIDFEFQKPVRVSAMYLGSIKYNRATYEFPAEVMDTWVPAEKGDIIVEDVVTTSESTGQIMDEDEYGTECTTIEQEDYDINVTENKRYFIGNFEVHGSSDASDWVLLGTFSNTTNIYKYIYLTNSQYYKYYRINILNNSSLNSTTFNTSYYGINSLKFYSYEFSEDSGDTPITAYNFDDIENPKIIKINNAESILGPEIHTVENTEEAITGETLISTISGTPNYYESYDVSLHSVTTPSDYLVDSVLESTVISGIAQDGGAGTLYISGDSTSDIALNGTASYTTVPGMPGYTMVTYNSTGSQTVLIDTVDYVGYSDYSYVVTASGLSTVSGSIQYDMTGTVTRSVDTYQQQRDFAYRLYVDEITTPEGTLVSGTTINFWGYTGRPLDIDPYNSVMFEVTTGEAYNCRLTAWDDVTHSTLLNELIQGDHARTSAVAFCCGGSKLDPGESKDPINLIRPPVHNLILKGNTQVGDTKYFYGDFDMVYRYQDDVYGDYLIFKPMLYGIHSGISYGVHDYIMTLHYSYT